MDKLQRRVTGYDVFSVRGGNRGSIVNYEIPPNARVRLNWAFRGISSSFGLLYAITIFNDLPAEYRSQNRKILHQVEQPPGRSSLLR